MAKAGKRSQGEVDYDYARAKKSRLSESNRQPPRISGVSDSEEDLGHSTRVKSMAAAKVPANRSLTVVSNLKNTVEEGKKKLVTLLEEKVLGAKRDYELKGTLIKFILDAQQDQTEMDERRVKHLSASKLTTSAIYLRAKSNLASSRELLGHYERASQQVAFSRRVPMTDSGREKDNQTLQHILHERREKVKLEIRQFLKADVKPSKEQVKGGLSKLDTDLWDRFAVGEAKKEYIKVLDGKGATWAEIAKNAQEGVRRAVKDLPEDGE